jgi:hypothetical protein
MNIKDRAYELHKSGLSYKQISDQLGISKTSAYEHVKEVRLIQAAGATNPIPNLSELGMNDRSERSIKQEPVPEINSEKPTIKTPLVKTFIGDELVKKEFIIYDFSGSKFQELIGNPSKPFHGFIYGLPKNGKSYVGIFFGDYFQEYHGKVLYVAAEEGESVTLKQKFLAINGSKMTVLPSRDRDVIRGFIKSSGCKLVIIDSINNAGIDSAFLESIKDENPNVSTIIICQATKAGNFKGEQELTHNCDFIIEVISGIAKHSGRFNCDSEIDIFKEPLYKKNPLSNKEVQDKEKTVYPDILKIPEAEVPMKLQSAENRDTAKEIVNNIKPSLTELLKPIESHTNPPPFFLKRDILKGLSGFNEPPKINQSTNEINRYDWKKKYSPAKKNINPQLTTNKVLAVTGAWVIGSAIKKLLSNNKKN